MEQKYLLDSDVIIGYLAGKIPAPGMKIVSDIIDKSIDISVISQIEVLRFNDTPENEKILVNFINSSIIHSLNIEIVRKTIDLCKQSKIKLPDAIVAATSLIENFVLVTRNIDDYKKIPDIELLNPWEVV